MRESDCPTAVAIDPIEYLLEARSACQTHEFSREVLLQRLPSLRSPALKISVDLIRQISDQHVHACRTLA